MAVGRFVPKEDINRSDAHLPPPAAAVRRALLVTPFDPKAQQFADEAQCAGAKARLVGRPRAK